MPTKRPKLLCGRDWPKTDAEWAIAFHGDREAEARAVQQLAERERLEAERAEYERGARFCRQCGMPPRRCDNCGAVWVAYVAR